MNLKNLWEKIKTTLQPPLSEDDAKYEEYKAELAEKALKTAQEQYDLGKRISKAKARVKTAKEAREMLERRKTL